MYFVKLFREEEDYTIGAIGLTSSYHDVRVARCPSLFMGSISGDEVLQTEMIIFSSVNPVSVWFVFQFVWRAQTQKREENVWKGDEWVEEKGKTERERERQRQRERERGRERERETQRERER
jgi:hypothetical protein